MREYGPHTGWYPEDDDGYDPDDDCSAHAITCGCEDCMQNYPERFDSEWENIYYVEPEPIGG